MHRFTRRFSMELTVSRSSGTTGHTIITGGGDFQTRYQSWTVTPVDLAASYHFINGVAWKPYVGAAVRWTGAPDIERAEDNTTFGPAAGVVWQFRENVGLRLDGRLLLGDNMDYSSVLNASVGVAWRF